jgi:phage virion morphogenesis protein
MAAGALEFNVKEIDGLAALLNKAQLSSQDREQLLRNLATEAEAQTQDRFDAQIDPEGKKWKDLADKTMQYYAKYFPNFLNGSLLYREGGLRDSIESQLSNSWSIMVGATKIYAAVHQFGYKNIPARPYAGISQRDAEQLAAITQSFLAGQIK